MRRVAAGFPGLHHPDPDHVRREPLPAGGRRRVVSGHAHSARDSAAPPVGLGRLLGYLRLFHGQWR